MSLRVLNWESKKSRFRRQLQCQEQCIDHIPHYPSGLSGAVFSDNLSRNSCIFSEKATVRSRSGRSHAMLPAPKRLLQTDVHFLRICLLGPEGSGWGGGGGGVKGGALSLQ